MASEHVIMEATIECASGDGSTFKIQRVKEPDRGWELSVKTPDGDDIRVSVDDLAGVVAAFGEVMP